MRIFSAREAVGEEEEVTGEHGRRGERATARGTAAASTESAAAPRAAGAERGETAPCVAKRAWLPPAAGYAGETALKPSGLCAG